MGLGIWDLGFGWDEWVDDEGVLRCLCCVCVSVRFVGPRLVAVFIEGMGISLR